MGKLKQLLFLIFFLPFAAIGQKNTPEALDGMVNQFIDELEAQGFEQIGLTKHFCVGYERIWKEGEKCDFEGTYYQVYVFWENNYHSFVKKFDNCGSFTQAEMSSSPFFEIFEANCGKLSSEEVQQFEYAQILNGKAETGKVKCDHSCRREFMVTLCGQKMEKSFDLFDLNKKDGNQENLHYSSNKKLALVKWDKRTSKLIWKIEKKHGFLREFPETEETQVSSK